MTPKYLVNYSYLNTIDTPEKAQILGLLYADGTLYEKQNAIKISLIEDDKEYLSSINRCFDSNRILYCDNRGGDKFYEKYNKTYNRKNSYILSFHNKILYEDCLKWGLAPNKTYTNSVFPDIDEQLINSFVLGLFEGDGCLTLTTTPSKSTDKKYQRYAFYLLLQEKFAIKLMTYLKETLNIKCNFRLHQNCSNSLYRLCILKINDLISLYHWLYRDTSFVMKRKHDKWLKLMNIFKEKGYAVGELKKFQ